MSIYWNIVSSGPSDPKNLNHNTEKKNKWRVSWFEEMETLAMNEMRSFEPLFYNGQIQMQQFTQRLRDKQAKKTGQNTNLASKRTGGIGKVKKNPVSVQRWPGSAEDEFVIVFYQEFNVC